MPPDSQIEEPIVRPHGDILILEEEYTIRHITVPAGFIHVVYEPKYVLNEKKDAYERKTGEEKTELETPLPQSETF